MLKLTNERKSEILSLLADGDWWTASGVAEALGMSLTNASELLRRYHKNGLLVRQRLKGPGAPPRGYRYRITDKGTERLSWLQSLSQDDKWEVHSD